jgi:ribonuclease HI
MGFYETRFKVGTTLEIDSLHLCFLEWRRGACDWKEMPCFISWEIWKQRNLVLFEDRPASVLKVKMKAIVGFKEHHREGSDFGRKIAPPPVLNDHYPVGFFDGASQDGGQKCGAGVFIKMNSSLSFRLKLNCGQGTNTRGELLSLWSLLFFADSRNFHQMQILGDSKVIVDWFNHKAQLQVATLQGWIQKICMLAMNFSFLSLSHIYREYNSVADKLSKEALLLDEGRLVVEEFEGNIPGPLQFIDIF